METECSSWVPGIDGELQIGLAPGVGQFSLQMKIPPTVGSAFVE